MESQNIEDLIALDLQTFLNLNAKNNNISIDDALEIAAYVSANFMRIIYAKNKSIEKHEINGIFGIVSNFYNSFFDGQITEEEFKDMANKSTQLLQNTSFDEMSKAFFNKIITESESDKI